MFRLTFLTLTITLISTAPGLTLDEVPARVRTANPELAAARLRIAEASGRLQQSGRLANPELELDYEHDTRGRESILTVALTQRFPLTARLRHEKTASRAQLAAAEAEVREVERQLIAHAQDLAVKLLALQGQRALRLQQLTNTQELAAFLQKRTAAGEASALDTAQIEIEAQQIDVQQLQLAAEEAALTGELRPLLGLAGNARVNLTGTLPAPTPAPARMATRPDLEAAKRTAEAAKASLSKERASRFEDIGLSVTAGRERFQDDPNSTDTDHMVGFRLSIPLPLWHRNEGHIAEAAAAAARTQREVEALTLRAAAEATSAQGEMAARQKLLRELDDRLLPKAAEIEDQLRQAYASGQTPLLEVLRARARRLEFQQLRLEALRDYHLARVRLLAATGANLSIK
jgi:cobalt-zinc-cadmium efflux system outer membrane protein